MVQVMLKRPMRGLQFKHCSLVTHFSGTMFIFLVISFLLFCTFSPEICFCFTRNSDVKTRRKYVDLTESVKSNGGEVFVFSSEHVSGEREFCSF